MTSKRKIVHLTSAHPRYDTRIFIKQCRSLSNNGFEVSLIVADGKGDESSSGVAILDVGSPSSRFDRFFRITKLILKRALDIGGDVFHLHDPELIPIGIKLKKMGKIVLFDAHEDVPNQIRSKAYLNRFSQRLLSFLFSYYEIIQLRKFDYIVSATPTIRDKFTSRGLRSNDVNNYPIISEFGINTSVKDKSLPYVVYIGGLNKVRGTKEIVEAIEICRSDVRLVIGGRFEDPVFEERIKALPGWRRVDFRGWMSREQISGVLSGASAGLVTLHPTLSYIDSLPVKMFEYMAAEVPVVASNFPLWQRIVKEEECGVCVNPMSPNDIAKAIDYLILSPERVSKLGINGRLAVENHLNWQEEETKLLNIYYSVLKINPEIR